MRRIEDHFLDIRGIHWRSALAAPGVTAVRGSPQTAVGRHQDHTRSVRVDGDGPDVEEVPLQHRLPRPPGVGRAVEYASTAEEDGARIPRMNGDGAEESRPCDLAPRGAAIR